MAFRNRVRLPINVTRPQFPAEISTYRKANGDTVTLSAVVRKTYLVNTEWMPESWHEKTRLAFLHDDIYIESEKYIGKVAMTAPDYNIVWNDDRKNYPIAPADFAIDITPYLNTNSNCMSCEDATSVDVVDDKFPTGLAQDTDYSLNLLTNDSICCYPVTFDLISFNSTYLTTATLDTEGVLHVHTKTTLPVMNGVLMGVYRATCSNGSYDEANIYADLAGTVPSCLAPSNVRLITTGPTTAEIAFDQPSPVADHYYFKVVRLDTNAVVIQTYIPLGATLDPKTGPIHLTGLPSDTSFRFSIRSQCNTDPTHNPDDTASNYVTLDFETPAPTSTCGQYAVFAQNFSSDADLNANCFVTYTDCNGIGRRVAIKNYTTSLLNCLQSSPGNPFLIVASGPDASAWTLRITYNGVA